MKQADIVLVYSITSRADRKSYRKKELFEKDIEDQAEINSPMRWALKKPARNSLGILAELLMMGRQAKKASG